RDCRYHDCDRRAPGQGRRRRHRADDPLDCTLMETLRVELGSRGYPILIGEGLLGQKALFEQYVRARDVLIVSNTVVAPLYLETLAASLQPRRVVATILPDGESHKTLANAARVLDVLVANRFGRDC